MEFVKGPDFPTGGLIMGRAGLVSAFRTGRGSVKLRARAEIEQTSKGGERIVVTEIPYQTSVEEIERKMAELVHAKVLEGIREIRNERSKGRTRLVIELKRDAAANVVLNNLYKHTPLQGSFAVNMVALVDGVPRTLTLRDALLHYVEHQEEVIRRRSEFRLAKARRRAHIVEGFLRALDLIDEIIAAIRASADRAAAIVALQGEAFSFSEVQATEIVDMRLSTLTRLGRERLEEEMAQLRATIAELEAILSDDARLRAVIAEELGEIRDEFATERRSSLEHDEGDLDVEDLIDDEDVVVVMTRRGYIKTVAADAFRTQGRGGRGVAGAALKDEDDITDLIHTSTHAYLLFFTNRGRVYRLKAHRIPRRDRTAQGMAIVNLLRLQPEERVQAVIDTRDYETHRFLFFVTRSGGIKKTLFNAYDNGRQDGLIALRLREDDELVQVLPTSGHDDLLLVTEKGQGIRFSEDDARPMGRDAQGVRGIRLRPGDRVVSAAAVSGGDAMLLTITDAGYGKRTSVAQFNRQHRGGQGVRVHRLRDPQWRIIAAMLVEEGDDLLLINDGGTVMRTSVSDISTQGRDATGVRVMAVTGATRVAAAARILTTDDTDDTDGTVDPGVPGAGPASAGVVDGSAAAGGAVSEGGTGDGEDA
jgi:DNA gyrase subunit A